MRDDVWTSFSCASQNRGDGAAIARFIRALKAIDPTELRATDEQTLLGCLADAVAVARYWQEPDEEDMLLAMPQVSETLRQVMENALPVVIPQWWSSSIALHEQMYVQWLDEHRTQPPALTGAAKALRQWRQAAVAEERDAHTRPDDPAVNLSGTWWSMPLPDVVVTSRKLPYLGAAQLLLTEDDMGWRLARIWPLSPAAGPRVYEVTCPQSWVDLVHAYPLRVTRSRLHDWYRTTGRSGEWFIPDWEAVAADYDAAYLSVSAYLATAGRALRVDRGATVLAGWSPDSTYWLNDVLRSGGPATVWRLHESEDDDLGGPPREKGPPRSCPTDSLSGAAGECR